MNARLAAITATIFVTLALIIFLFNNLNTERPLRANVYPREVLVNDFILFADSTEDVSKYLWEFGNGDKSKKQKGAYRYTREGNYIVRLTLDKDLKDTFLVHVKKPITTYKKDTSILIYANRTGIAGEEIHFKLLGTGIDWCEWYFGETGKIDARSAEAFYSYSSPGTFTVKLLSNLNPKKPLTHTVKILPKYKILESVPKKAGKGGEPKVVDKLKLAIQNIANGANFTTNYNMIVSKFLCSNPKIQVVANGKPPIDFYSYCQSLHLSSGITIDQVTPVTDPKSNCTTKLVVTQH